MPDSLSKFDFQSSTVRAIIENGEIWFVAKDIALSLKYSGTNMTTIFSAVPEEWKGIKRIATPGGKQKLITISEQGLYFFLGRSDKPQALPFQKWLAGEVLPAIRKTGEYVSASDKRPSLSPAMQQELRADIRGIKSGWLHLSSAYVHNHLRAAFGVDNIAEIPPELFPEAKRYVAFKKQAAWEFLGFMYELKEKFNREVLGGGEPWTVNQKPRRADEQTSRLPSPDA